MYALNEEQVIDPTNADGTVDLEITFLFGLIKVDTTIARINEPPTGGDVNVFTRVDASGVSVVAERNIFTGEEVFMDYGRVYDRSDYEREEQRAQEAEVRPSSRHCPLLCCHPFIHSSIHPFMHTALMVLVVLCQVRAAVQKRSDEEDMLRLQPVTADQAKVWGGGSHPPG